MENNIRTFMVSEDWAALDRRWAAQIRVAGRTLGAYGSTREDAIDALRLKLRDYYAPGPLASPSNE